MADLTKKVESSSADLETSDRLQRYAPALVQNLPDAVVLVDERGVIRYLNPAGCRIFGYAPEELIGRHGDHLVAPADRGRLQAVVDEFFALIGEGVFGWRRDLKMLRKDGSEFHGEFSVCWAPTEEGGRVFLLYVRDVDERRRLEEQIETLAYSDPLTGLPNRRRFEESWRRLAVPGHRPIALLYVDLNRFKEVNDTLGHHFGDALLVEVGRRIAGVVGERARLARFGGDEFAILLPQATPGEAAELAQRLVDALDAPFEMRGQRARSGANIGIALTTEGASGFDEVMRRADIALYRAKALHIGFHFYEEADGLRVREQVWLLDAARHALESDDFEVHYQPVYDLRTGRTERAEALLRWSHPERGWIPPGQFMALAEEGGTAAAYDEWVIRRVLQDSERWPNLTLSVNLTPQTFLDPAFPDRLGGQLERCNRRVRLALEVTERAFTDPTRFLRNLSAVKALGVLVWVDDFGSGYSSLARIEQFPLDLVKTSAEFIRGRMRNRKVEAIVNA
ncbi:MAG TPA: EAL domain-containing protein, partial [Limnochordia bacterium]|nr:EAL domain-containing protein [Limnochordia bacterium]